jgi:hypothetical protein
MPAATLTAPAAAPMTLPIFFPWFLTSMLVDWHFGQLIVMGYASFCCSETAVSCCPFG